MVPHRPYKGRVSPTWAETRWDSGLVKQELGEGCEAKGEGVGLGESSANGGKRQTQRLEKADKAKRKRCVGRAESIRNSRTKFYTR